MGVFNPALTIPNQKSPCAKLGKNSQHPGTAKLAIDSAGLNAPASWNGIRWIFDAVNNAVIIVFAEQEPSKIGWNCLTIAMVNPVAPGGKLDVSRLWSPNRRTKIKRPRHLNQVWSTESSNSPEKALTLNLFLPGDRAPRSFQRCMGRLSEFWRDHY